MAVDDGMNLAIALGRDDGGDTAMLQFGEDGVGVLALITRQNLRLWPGLDQQYFPGSR